jgi:hypothetical protein
LTKLDYHNRLLKLVTLFSPTLPASASPTPRATLKAREPPAPPARVPAQTSVVAAVDVQGTSTNPNHVTNDCVIAFGNSPLGSATANRPFNVVVDESWLVSGLTMFLSNFSMATQPAPPTVSELDSPNAIQTLFGVT